MHVSILCSCLFMSVLAVITSVWVELCVVEVVDDVTDGLDRPVHLEVAYSHRQNIITYASFNASMPSNKAIAGHISYLRQRIGDP